MDCLRYWSGVLPEKAAYCLYDGEESEVVWTYKHLDRLARSIAVELSKLDIEGERVLLLYPPGLDFVAGLMARKNVLLKYRRASLNQPHP